MANKLDNLKPLNTLSKEEAKAIRSKGGKVRQGIAVRKAIKQRKTFREHLLFLLEQGRAQEEMLTAIIDKGRVGDITAFKEIRDTIGEKPKEQVESDVNISIGWIKE
jgi:hypothetical protein